MTEHDEQDRKEIAHRVRSHVVDAATSVDLG